VTSYDAGRRLEWDVRKRLIADGYQLVLRSAGSKTKVDIVAFKLDQVLFVQAKANGLCPPAERVELLRVAGLLPGIAVPVVASRPKVTFRRLTGPGPQQWEPWSPDILEAV
jgi:hypothetical protein